MVFEVDLPPAVHVFLLRHAGLVTDAYVKLLIDDPSASFEVPLPCILTDPPRTVQVARLPQGGAVRVRITASEAALERMVRDCLERYSVQNEGGARCEHERNEVLNRIDAALGAEGLDVKTLGTGPIGLHRRAIEALIRVSDEVEPIYRSLISDVFTNGPIAPEDREFAVRWLMRRFAQTRDPLDREQLSLRIAENVVPAIGEDLIGLIGNPGYGNSRGGLLQALAETGHPRAADVIADMTEEAGCGWFGIRALAKLRATEHVDVIRRCLAHPDAEIRREATKALRRFGLDD